MFNTNAISKGTGYCPRKLFIEINFVSNNNIIKQ